MWTIDRREVYHAIYRLEHGHLIRMPTYAEITGWPSKKVTRETPLLYECFDRGGVFIGLFDHMQLAGIAVIDTIPLGDDGDQLQLKYLHVSRPYRGQRIGQLLFRKAQMIAHSRGARALYISATPTEQAVNFYQRCGAVINPKPNPELYALEPEDIHLICPVL